MNIIDRLTQAQRVLEEHTQYDNHESGEAKALATCIDAKLTITELTDLLQRIVEDEAETLHEGYLFEAQALIEQVTNR